MQQDNALLADKPEKSLEERRRSAVRTALVLAAVAVGVYVWFIVSNF